MLALLGKAWRDFWSSQLETYYWRLVGRGAKDAATYPAVHRTARTTEKCRSAKAKKSCSKAASPSWGKGSRSSER